MALSEQICLREVLKQACLFEELVEGVDPVVEFYAQALAFAVENRNVSHRPFDAALVEIDDVAIFHIDHLLAKIDGDVGLGGQNVNLNLAVDELADHLFGRRQLPAARCWHKLNLEPVVPVSFG